MLPRPVRLEPMRGFPIPTVARAMASGFDDPGEVAQWEQLLARELDSERACAITSRVAIRGDTIVGCCLVNRGPGTLARIGPTAVLPEARRGGIGRRLVTGCLTGLRAVGAGDISLEVSPHNRPARELYRSLGFRDGRGLRTLSTRRSSLTGAGGPYQTERVSPHAALRIAGEHHPEVPAFQRRRFYLESFVDGVVAHAVRDERGAWLGGCLQRGRALLDIAAQGADPSVLAALAWAATDLSWQLRLINVVDDDPCGDALVRLGFSVESEAIQMVYGEDSQPNLASRS